MQKNNSTHHVGVWNRSKTGDVNVGLHCGNSIWKNKKKRHQNDQCYFPRVQWRKPCLIYLERGIFVKPHCPRKEMICEFHIFITGSLQKEHLSFLRWKCALGRGKCACVYWPRVRLASNQIFLFLLQYIHFSPPFFLSFLSFWHSKEILIFPLLAALNNTGPQ